METKWRTVAEEDPPQDGFFWVRNNGKPQPARRIFGNTIRIFESRCTAELFPNLKWAPCEPPKWEE